MKKLVEITHCEDCPYLDLDSYTCTNTKNGTEPRFVGWDTWLGQRSFPDWCPLPNAEEEPTDISD